MAANIFVVNEVRAMDNEENYDREKNINVSNNTKNIFLIQNWTYALFTFGHFIGTFFYHCLTTISTYGIIMQGDIGVLDVMVGDQVSS